MFSKERLSIERHTLGRGFRGGEVVRFHWSGCTMLAMYMSLDNSWPLHQLLLLLGEMLVGTGEQNVFIMGNFSEVISEDPLPYKEAYIYKCAGWQWKEYKKGLEDTLKEWMRTRGFTSCSNSKLTWVNFDQRQLLLAEGKQARVDVDYDIQNSLEIRLFLE